MDEIELIIAETRAKIGLTRAYLQDSSIKISKKMNANFVSKLAFRGGASGRTRTYNPSVNSRMFVQHRKTVSTIICDAELQHGLCRGLCSLPSLEMLLQFFPLNNSYLLPAFSKPMPS